MQTNSLLTVILRIITSFYDMLRRSVRFACMILIALLTTLVSVPASAQVIETLRVDIVNGLPDGDGSAWGTDAFRFLQDAIGAADVLINTPGIDEVHIWVAQGTYRPDQNKNNDDPDHPEPSKECVPDWFQCISNGGNECCPPYGNCDEDAVFDIGSNIHLYGGFPPDPHTWNQGQGAEFGDRDPAVYETILSGDLAANMVGYDHTYEPPKEVGFTRRDNVIIDYTNGCVELTFENYLDNSKTIVSIENATNAVVDGFTVRGRIHISGAGARLRDCTFIVAEGPALRCFGASNIQLWRCAFAIRSDDRAKNRTNDEFIFADYASEVIIINSRILRNSTEALPVNIERLPRRLECLGEGDSQHSKGKPVIPNWREEATGR